MQTMKATTSQVRASQHTHYHCTVFMGKCANCYGLAFSLGSCRETTHVLGATLKIANHLHIHKHSIQIQIQTVDNDNDDRYRFDVRPVKCTIVL